jgi:CRISPR/Cas system-associated exonuclease Cas4 (RecB family)
MNDVESIVYTRFREYQNKFVNGSGRLNTIHVSDIIQECLRKSYYSAKYPKEADDRLKGILYIGQAIHNLSKIGDIHEVTMCYDFANNKPMDMEDVKNASKEEQRYILTGTCDDVIFDKKYGAIIVDKKTWSSKGWVKKEPSIEHVRQLNAYRFLLNKTRGIDAKYGVVLYLDKYTEMETPLPMLVKLDDIGLTEGIIREKISILNDGMPKATPCWLCNKKVVYCKYKEECDKDMT